MWASVDPGEAVTLETILNLLVIWAAIAALSIGDVLVHARRIKR